MSYFLARWDVEEYGEVEMKKINDKVLVQQLEKHADTSKMLDQVRDVVSKIKNLKIIKKMKKQFLVIEEEDV